MRIDPTKDGSVTAFATAAFFLLAVPAAILLIVSILESVQ